MPRGGARPGSGRPKGSKDRATLAREAALAAAIEKIKQERSEAGFTELSMLEIVEVAARGLMDAGDLKGAAQVAALALPYRAAKKAPEAPDGFGLPPDLMPDKDPAPEPDEPGPTHPIH